MPAHSPSDMCAHLPEYDMENESKANSKKKKSGKTHGSKRFSALKHFLMGSDSSHDSVDVSQNTHSQDNEETKLCEPQTGRYTYKQYKLYSMLPWYLQKLVSKDTLILHERCWNLYPIIKTHIKNDYLKSEFHIYMDTIVKEFENNEFDENVHNLTAEQLEKREIYFIDISKHLSASEYVESEDPRKFKSESTDRGQLLDNWWLDKTRPVICSYKLVECEFAWYGLQSKVESYIINSYKKLFTKYHRIIYCWSDKWHGLNSADLRALENELQDVLKTQINEGEIRVKKFVEDDET